MDDNWYIEQYHSEENGIQSVDRALHIIELIKFRDGATLAELDEQFDLAKSTIHRHLQTLRKHGYVVLEDGTYNIGLRFLDPAFHAKQDRIYQIADEVIANLTEEADQRAQFAVEQNGRGIVVSVGTGSGGPEVNSRVGEVIPLHSTAIGKAILAYKNQDEVQHIITEYGLEQITENTITDADTLVVELREIRERGYAFNDEESRKGMQAIGVPVLDEDEQVLGSLSMALPRYRMEKQDQEDLQTLLSDFAEQMRLEIIYS